MGRYGYNQAQITIIPNLPLIQFYIQTFLLLWPKTYKTYQQIYFDDATIIILNATPTSKRKMISMLTKLEKEEKIIHEQYIHLYPTSDMIPRFIRLSENSQKKEPASVL